MTSYFKYRMMRTAIYIVAFIISATFYVAYSFTYLPEVDTSSGKVCSLAAFFIVPWSVWFVLSSASYILVPPCIRATITLSGGTMEISRSRGQMAWFWLGLGISGSGLWIGAVADPSFIPGGLSGGWRIWVVLLGISCTVCYLFLCAGSHVLVIGRNEARGVGQILGWKWITNVSDLQEIKITNNSTGQIVDGTVEFIRVSPGGRSRVLEYRQALHMPLAIFNSPGAPSLQCVEELTNTTILLS